MRKKITKKKTPVVKNEVIVRVIAPEPVESRELEPLKETGKYALVGGFLQEKQILRMVQRTPPAHIYTRPGKGGQNFSYVTGVYVTKLLNFAFRFNWDFEVVAHGKEGNQIWVHGKLTVKDDKGHTITKSQFGRSDIKMLKSGGMVDYGNDLKAATTDALKKCASLLGIASDVYGKAEFKQEAGVDVADDVPPRIAAPTATITRPLLTPEIKNDQTLRCKVCAKTVTQGEAEYSQARFKKILCREHQNNK